MFDRVGNTYGFIIFVKSTLIFDFVYTVHKYTSTVYICTITIQVMFEY